MADDGTGEKTEEPTPERLRKLRKEGNVAKSQDVIHAVSFLGVFVTLAAAFGFMGEQLSQLMHLAMSIAATKDVTTAEVNGLLSEGLITMAKVSAPALAAAFVLGMVLNVGQVGFMFTLKPITPDVKKLNPIAGFKNLFNKKKLVELLKTAIKFVVVSWLSYVALKDALRDVVMTIRVGGF